MLTICIPLYNSNLTYLKKAVDSVLSQSSEEWILYLIDGSPTPKQNIARWIKELKHPKISYLINTENKTLSGNWNYAFKVANTEFVTLLHDDDLLGHHYVEKMMKLAHKYPKSTAYFCQVSLINEEGKKTRNLADYVKRFIIPKGDIIHLSQDDGLAQLLKGTFIFCPTLCYRKSLLVDSPFSYTWNMVTDLDFYINTLRVGGKLTGTNANLYKYRRHSFNQTKILTENMQRFEEEIKLYDSVSKEFDKKTWPKSVSVATNKNIIKLHLTYLILRSFLQLKFGRSYRLFLFLIRRL